MAEIKIEQKKPIWPWMIAGLVIVALIVIFLVFRDNGKDTAEVSAEVSTEVPESSYIIDTNEPALSGVEENNGMIAAYVNFVEDSRGRMGLDHAYTNEALLKLIEAINARANEVGYEIRADLEGVKEYAKGIKIDPYETTHADGIRKAADILTNVLEDMQLAIYPGLTAEVDELKSASASIDPEVLTLEQKEAVKNYFSKASDLLQKMN